MKAIILAAGIGTRLGKSGKKLPKCLIEIGGQTILERQIKILNSCGIESKNIIVIIGKEGKVWTKENKNIVKNLHNHTIINPENIEKNQSYSLWLAIKDLDDEILCIDGDSIFEPQIIRDLIANEHSSILLTREGDKSENRLRVSINEGRVNDIGNNIISERIYTPILKFDRFFLEALKRELSSEKYFENTLNVPINIICKKVPLYNLSIKNSSWPKGLATLNINTPEEYKRATKLFN